MIKSLDSNKNNFNSSLDYLLLNRKKRIKFNSNLVIKIINDVKKNGDKALLKYENRFGKNSTIIIKAKEVDKQIRSLKKKVKLSIDLAYNRIFQFHSKQKVKNIFYKDKLKNKLSYKYLPIESVGIYVPGGTASCEKENPSQALLFGLYFGDLGYEYRIFPHVTLLSCCTI